MDTYKFNAVAFGSLVICSAALVLRWYITENVIEDDLNRELAESALTFLFSLGITVATYGLVVGSFWCASENKRVYYVPMNFKTISVTILMMYVMFGIWMMCHPEGTTKLPEWVEDTSVTASMYGAAAILVVVLISL